MPLLFFHVYLGLQCTVLEKSLYSDKSVERVLICGRILSVFGILVFLRLRSF